MAKERHEKGKRDLHELRQEIAHSRDRLARDLGGLSYELDFSLKFRKSFQRHAGRWISAAVLTGVVIMARSLPQKKVIYSPSSKKGEKAKGEEQKKGLLGAGLAIGGLRFAAAMLKPVVVNYISGRVGEYARRGGPYRPPGRL